MATKNNTIYEEVKEIRKEIRKISIEKLDRELELSEMEINNIINRAKDLKHDVRNKRKNLMYLPNIDPKKYKAMFGK